VRTSKRLVTHAFHAFLTSEPQIVIAHYCKVSTSEVEADRELAAPAFDAFDASKSSDHAIILNTSKPDCNRLRIVHIQLIGINHVLTYFD
jgi:hypothetical protein